MSSSPIRVDRSAARWVVVLAACFILTCFTAMKHATPAYDEGPHLKYGLLMLKGNSDRFDDSKMPVSALNAYFFVKSGNNVYKARVATVLFSLLGALAVFFWTRELYGIPAGLFSMALYVFEPNILAHSQFIGTDAYCWVATAIAAYLFWRFMKYGGRMRGWLAAITLGVSQLTKYMCLHLLPIYLILALMQHGKNWNSRKHVFGFLKWSAVFLITTILIINAGFLFNKTMMPLKDYEFKSKAMQTIQEKILKVANPPVFFPYPFIQGIDLLKEVEETGGGNGRNYLFGQLKEKGQGFKGYYFFAWLFKMPIATLVFWVLAATLLIRNRKNLTYFENENYLVLPILYFMVYFNFFANIQIGIRYSIVAFPFIFVLCGLVWKWAESSKNKKTIAVVLLIYQLVSVYSYAPHYLSYFNELVPDRKKAYKILADSNIDWGNNVYYLKDYILRHPDSHMATPQPRTGRQIVGINQLVGINDPERFRWLRDHFEPKDHIAYSYLVYEISDDDIQQI